MSVNNFYKWSVYQNPGLTTDPIFLNCQSDTFAQIVAPGYLATQIAAGLVINAGDLLFISYSGGYGMFAPSNASSAGPVTLSSMGMQSAKVNITAAQFNGMYAAPVQLVAAPGAGFMLLPSQVILDMTFVSAQYAAGGVVAAQYDSTVHGGGVLATNTQQASDFTGAAASTIFTFGLSTGNGSSKATASVANKALYLSNQTAAFTTGDSTFVATTYFKTIAV